jgi:hypothetical protein
MTNSRYFKLDSELYSFFPEEEEVLIYDGYKYRIVEVTEEVSDNQKYTLIKLTFLS